MRSFTISALLQLLLGRSNQGGRIGGSCSTYVEMTHEYMQFENPKEPRGRPRPIWEVSIEVELQNIKCEGVEWIQLAQKTSVEGCCEQVNELSGFFTNSATVNYLLKKGFSPWI
jgi:hypothetical protein